MQTIGYLKICIPKLSFAPQCLGLCNETKYLNRIIKHFFKHRVTNLVMKNFH